MQKTMYGQARLSIIPMRAEARHCSEMVSQLLYNETYTILEEQKEWFLIEALHDAYQGWIASNQVHYISQEVFDTPFKRYNPALIEWDAQLQQHLYMGSPFYDLKPTTDLPIDRICQAAQQFINSPYLWGGRSAAGIDCSGLMQIIFRMGNVFLPRDASQQVNIGQPITWGNQQKGDLAFFVNKAEKITHVGLVLTANTLLHASAWVRTDQLNEKGIFYHKNQTHHLSVIKRIL